MKYILYPLVAGLLLASSCTKVVEHFRTKFTLVDTYFYLYQVSPSDTVVVHAKGETASLYTGLKFGVNKVGYIIRQPLPAILYLSYRKNGQDILLDSTIAKN